MHAGSLQYAFLSKCTHPIVFGPRAHFGDGEAIAQPSFMMQQAKLVTHKVMYVNTCYAARLAYGMMVHVPPLCISKMPIQD